MYSNIPWSICVGCTSNHIKESRSKGGWHSPSWWERLRLLLQDSGNVVQGTQIFIQSLFELGDRNYAWPSEHLEYQMSFTCQKQVLKDSTDMFYTFFTLFHSNEDYKHPFISELKYEIFGTWISGKFGKEVAWSTEFGQWVYLQGFEPEWGSISKCYREKRRTLHTSILGACFQPHPSISTCLNASCNWAPKQHKPFAPSEERNSWDLCSLNFEHWMLTSLIASNRVSKARAMQTFVHEQLTLNSFQNAGASLLGRPVVFTRQVSRCQLFPMLWIRTRSLCYRFHDHSPCSKRLRNARHCLQALALHRVSVCEGHLFSLEETCQQQLTNFGPINFVCVKIILNLFFDLENNWAWVCHSSCYSRRQINEPC